MAAVLVGQRRGTGRRRTARLWYRNLYFLRCVSKPGVEAVGLYAGLTNDNPPWHGGHTLNYNSEQTF